MKVQVWGMSISRSLKALLFGCISSIGVFAGAPEYAVAQNIASMSPSALRDLCTKGTDYDPSRIEIACSDALRSNFLDDHAKAAAHNRRAQAFTDLGRRDKAISDYDDSLTILDKLIGPDISEPADLFQRAVALQGLGRIDRALATYTEVLQRDPNEVQALINRGTILSGAGKYGQAIADFDNAIRLMPDNVLAYMERGNAYGQTGEFARSLADLNKAISLSPSNAQTYVMRGVSLGHQGKNQRALADYSTALSINPRNVDALTDRAAISELQGDNDKAVKDLTTAISLLDNDNDSLAHYNRGVAYFAMQQYDKALADYTAAIEIDGKMDVAYGNRCLTRVLLGRELAKASDDCDKAIELNPNGQNLYNVRGFVDLKLGRNDQALADYNTALKLDPNSPHALYGRGLAKKRRGDVDGEADRSAARAARPNIEQSFSMFGVF
jgi:tetratricopeptide (TPR) repeat protein